MVGELGQEEVAQQGAEQPAEGENQLSALIAGIVDSMGTLVSVLEESADQVDPQGKAQVQEAAQMFQDGISKLTGGAPQEQAQNNAVPAQSPEGRPVGPAGV